MRKKTSLGLALLCKKNAIYIPLWACVYIILYVLTNQIFFEKEKQVDLDKTSIFIKILIADS